MSYRGMYEVLAFAALDDVPRVKQPEPLGDNRPPTQGERMMTLMDRDRWYTYPELSEMIGVPERKMHNLIFRMTNRHLVPGLETKRVPSPRWKTQLQTLVRYVGPKTFPVPPGFDHTLLAAHFPKYVPLEEEAA